MIKSSRAQTRPENRPRTENCRHDAARDHRRAGAVVILELKPIIEKDFRKIEIDLNPIFEKERLRQA
jgi:hypothetical protein